MVVNKSIVNNVDNSKLKNFLAEKLKISLDMKEWI